MKRGDIVACTSHDLIGSGIRFAQRRAGDLDWDINHVATLDQPVGPNDWTIIQAEARGVTNDGLLSSLTPGGRHTVLGFPDAQADRTRYLEFLEAQVGAEYSWLSIASCAFDMALPESVCLRRADTFICSGLVGMGLLHAGFTPLDMAPDLYTVRPAQIIALLQGRQVFVKSFTKI